MSRAERITALNAQVRPTVLAADETVPVVPALEEALFPIQGLRRGSTVVVAETAQGATSLAFALAAGLSQSGAWCAAVAMPDLGLVAVAELGVALERLVLVPRVSPEHWVTAVGALLDSVDLVIARPPAHLRQGDARRLSTRARERGAVLVALQRNARHWSEGAEVRLTVNASSWVGVGAGDGRLLRRSLEVTASGRGAAARERKVELSLPIARTVRQPQEAAG